MNQDPAPQHAHPVVAVLDGPLRSGGAVDRAAQEAARRGVGLALLPLAGSWTGSVSGDDRGGGWLRRIVADLATEWPDVDVEVVAPAETAGAGLAIPASARMVVVDVAAGTSMGAGAGPADRPACPVLVAGADTHRHQDRVVVAALTQDRSDHAVVHRAVEEAVARGCELRLVMAYPRSSGEPEPCAADRAHRYLEALLATEPAAARLEVTAICTASPLAHVVPLQAYATELLVVHRGEATTWLDGVLRHPPTDLLVLPASPTDRDDDWDVGTANPAVSADVGVAWHQTHPGEGRPRW